MRRAVAFAYLAACAACSSSSTTVTSPSSVRCPVNLTLTPASVDAAGGSGQITIAVNRECTWDARSESDWITLGAPTSGQGEATLRYTAAANALVTTRRGAVVVNDQRAEIAQSAAACRFDLSAAGGSAAAEGGSLSVSVNAQATCAWTAVSQVDWVQVEAGRDGSGQGVVALSVARNAGAARQGMVQIAGQAYSVSQAAASSPQPQPQPGCTFNVTPSSEQFENNGGEGTIRITASAPNCVWAAVSSVPWISPAAGSGSGSGTARYVVAPNTGAARTGAIIVGTTTVTVTQAAAPVAPGCELTVSPQSESFPANGGDGTVRIAASASSCQWTAVSNVPWITVSTGSGTGSSNVRYAVAANSGAARTGILTAAGGTITVTQAAAPSTPSCDFEVSPTSKSFPANGGEDTVRVGASSGSCPWTAVSNAPWISVASNGGTGSSSVRYAVAPNPGPERTGTLTVARATVTIRQEAAPSCAFEVSPQSESFSAIGGDGRVRVRASGSSCSWTATSNASWIRLAGGGGNGNDDVRYLVEPNLGPARAGSITAAGATVIINQAALVPTPISLRGELSDLGGQCPNVTFTVDHRQVLTNGSTVFDERCDRLRNRRDAEVDGLSRGDGPVLALRVNQGRDD